MDLQNLETPWAHTWGDLPDWVTALGDSWHPFEKSWTYLIGTLRFCDQEILIAQPPSLDSLTIGDLVVDSQRFSFGYTIGLAIDDLNAAWIYCWPKEGKSERDDYERG